MWQRKKIESPRTLKGSAVRGGILFEFVTAAALVILGALVWGVLSTGRWSISLPGLGPSARSHAQDVDHWERSLWLIDQVHQTLVRNGVSDTDIVKTTNEERERGPVRWLQSTLEVNTPNAFGVEKFRAEISDIAEQKGLRIIKDRQRPNLWGLSIGEPGRIYQEIVFHH